MSVNMAEICENTKMGREHSLLGNYDTSLVYYQGVLQQIQKLLLTIKDPGRKQKWQQVYLTYLYYNYLYKLIRKIQFYIIDINTNAL